MLKVSVFLVILGMAPVFFLHPQEQETDEDWLRPGRAAVQRELRYAQALAPDMRTKLTVIAEIRDRAMAGGIAAEDKNALGILRYLTEEGTRSRNQNQSFAAKSFPEARRASCEALGYIGGGTSREILISVLELDPEPMVLSEAVFALGKITTEPDEKILGAFRNLLETKVLVSGGDNNLAMALLSAIGKLADSETGVRDEELFRALMRILDTPLSPAVRQKARQLIEKMKGF
jgi:HEAT repeat protein